MDVVATKSGVIISVRTQPGSSKNRIVGEYGGRLKLAVTAAPEKGKANKAVVELLAQALRICASSIQIVSGESSRNKKLIIEGVSPGDINLLLNVPAQ